jgi:hypothetical protein
MVERWRNKPGYGGGGGGAGEAGNTTHSVVLAVMAFSFIN